MSRFSYAASTSYSQLSRLEYRTLVDVGITSGTVYCINGMQYLFTLGNTYSPVGHLGTIEPIQEESDPFPRTVRLTLQGVSSADMYEPMRESMFGRPLVVRHVYLDPDTHLAVSTPETLWRGVINKVALNLATTDRGTYFELEAETDLRRAPPVTNYNKETMLFVSSGDTFFDYIDQVPLTKAAWGSHNVSHTPNKNDPSSPPRSGHPALMLESKMPGCVGNR